MKKYISVVKISLQEYFVYRLNFIIWRLRIIISILITFFLWQAIYSGQNQMFNYQVNQMLTYIILLSFIHGVILSTQTMRSAEEIAWGDLANFLIRPVNYLLYSLSRDVADKIINTFFSVIEIFFLIVFLRPPIFIQTDSQTLLLFAVAIVFAAVLYFLINMLLSALGFWSREVWAPRFVFYIVIAFLSGTYFPLDILPGALYNILLFLPFTYIVFFPLKIYLGNMSLGTVIFGFFISVLWLFILSLFFRYIYQKGLKKYTAEGK